MEIKDIAGISKPLTKLIEVISKGIGTAYKPRAIRKEAEAEAYKNEVLAKANAKKILLEGEAKIELLERAKQRLVYQELTRQENIEEIAEKSIKYLDEQVSEKTVDEDWRTRFFNKAQDVSNEEMREIWAKILANEVSKPGTISYRTLEIVSNLSKEEAELFQLACSFVSGNRYIIKFGNLDNLFDYGLKYERLLVLRDAGLLYNNDNLIKSINTIKIDSFPRFSIINFGSNEFYKIINLKNPETPEFRFNLIAALTKAGIELSQIINVEKNEKYFKDFIECYEKYGFKFIKEPGKSRN